MARKWLNPVLPGGLLSPLSGADELTATEETMIANMQAGTFDNETPGGAVDGSNTAFTLAASPSPAASLKLVHNGQLIAAGGVDYTLSNNAITMVNAPFSGDELRAWYVVDTDT